MSLGLNHTAAGRRGADRAASIRRIARLSARLLAVPALVAGLVLVAPSGASAQSGEVTIEKLTNGVDADAAPGPIVAPGSQVDWTFVVTAAGSTTLYDVIVSDSSGVVPDCDVNGDGGFDGSNVHPGPLQPGQSFTCGATGIVHGAEHGTFAATATVRAFDFTAASRFEDTDPSHHTPPAPFAADPKVSVQTLINGTDADASPGPYIAEGTPLTLSYVVTNNGNVPLTSIVVGDDSGLAVSCGAGGNTIAGPIAPGASVTCSASTIAAAAGSGLQAGSGTVQATALDPTTGAPVGNPRASDPLNYTPVELPGALAFTGPTQVYAIVGALLALGGAGLWLAALVFRPAAGRRKTAGTG